MRRSELGAYPDGTSPDDLLAHPHDQAFDPLSGTSVLGRIPVAVSPAG